MNILRKTAICGAIMLSAACVCPLHAEEAQPLKYVDALNFRMINKGFADTETPFTRLPKYLKDSVRADLWNRSECSSGLGIRFASNSKRIGVRYTLLWDTHMYHMADTGLKGTDLYILTDDGRWEYVNTNRPIANDKKECEKVFVENLDGRMHEYLIYLPLYDGVTKMEIAVDSLSEITMPKIDNPRKTKKIVMYGTSILQGGCATRTGMVATNMIQRDLNCEVVNLGFSGEGKMDQCMARAMAKIEDADVFVIDPVRVHDDKLFHQSRRIYSDCQKRIGSRCFYHNMTICRLNLRKLLAGQRIRKNFGGKFNNRISILQIHIPDFKLSRFRSKIKPNHCR